MDFAGADGSRAMTVHGTTSCTFAYTRVEQTFASPAFIHPGTSQRQPYALGIRRERGIDT